MGNPKKVKVEVHIVRDGSKDPPYDFWLDTKDHKVGKSKGDKLTFDNEGKYDGFDLDFELVDETGEGFLFMDQGYDANGKQDPNLSPMWVKKVASLSDPCPDHEFWDQFETTEVSKDNDTLHVHNKNEHKQLFKFALMFSRTPHQAPYEIMYDPGGDNENGPKPMSYASLATIMVTGVGAVAGGAIAVAAMPFATSVSVLAGAIIGGLVAFTIYRLLPTLGPRTA